MLFAADCSAYVGVLRQLESSVPGPVRRQYFVGRYNRLGWCPECVRWADALYSPLPAAFAFSAARRWHRHISLPANATEQKPKTRARGSLTGLARALRHSEEGWQSGGPVQRRASVRAHARIKRRVRQNQAARDRVSLRRVRSVSKILPRICEIRASVSDSSEAISRNVRSSK